LYFPLFLSFPPEYWDDLDCIALTSEDLVGLEVDLELVPACE